MFKDKVEFLIPNGIDGLLPFMDKIEGIFDATSAFDHANHWENAERLGKWAIDLTPSKIGKPIVPSLVKHIEEMQVQNTRAANYSMVTCGGQSSAPLIYAISSNAKSTFEVEISSSIASLSAGPATRRNIDQYIDSTEALARVISGVEKTKVILVLNPAEPPVMMRTTVTMKVDNIDLNKVNNTLDELLREIKQYVPGYDLIVEPHFVSSGTVSSTVKVTGAGYVLPEYSGNLDIINAAAVETARMHSHRHQGLGGARA
jgi:acetaldehyde dehydrogenase